MRAVTNSSKFLLLVLLYRIIIDAAYANIVSKLFAYEGFRSNFKYSTEVVSLIVLIIASFLFFKCYANKGNNLSFEILLVMFLMSFVPFTSMWGFGVLSVAYIVSNVLFWTILYFLTINHFDIGPKIKIAASGKRVLGDYQIQIIAVISAMIVLYISGKYTHFRFNFSLLNVYDLRAEARTYNLPTILSYAFSWTRPVNSILIAYFFLKKKWIWAVSCIVIQLLNFGIDGSKSTLLLTIFAVIVSLLPSFSLQKLNRLIVWGFMAVSLVGVLVYFCHNNIIPVSLFVRRVLFTPTDISTKYFDFFTHNTPDFFRQSFLRLFGFKSPYENLAYMISDVYYGQVSSANNGLIADAITNMGYIGIVLDPIMYAIVFHILDVVSARLDPRLHITVAMYISLMLVNSFLFRVLLTHGLIVTMIILYLIDPSEVGDGKYKNKVMQELLDRENL